MIIEQSSEEIKESLAVNANTAIRFVRLAGASLWSVSPGRFDEEMNVESEVRFRPGVCRNSEGTLVFGIDFKFIVRTAHEGAKPQDLIKISCLFEAEYMMNPKFDPTDSQLKAFHRGNAVFNCWPYFREFVQNGTVRMHLPPPPVPFLRLMPPKKLTHKKGRRSSAVKALKGASE